MLTEEMMTKIKDHVEQNNPGHTNPYHNARHIVGMTEVATNIYLREDPEGRDLDLIYLAGMFHDFGHTGGKESDEKNIEIACSELFRWSQGMNLGDLPKRAIAAIRCTQFPFVRGPSNLAEKCLRDADLLWASYTKDPKVVMEGLRSEIETASGKPFSYEQMLESQKSFLANAEMFTRTGKELMSHYGPLSLKLMAAYVEKRKEELAAE